MYTKFVFKTVETVGFGGVWYRLPIFQPYGL